MAFIIRIILIIAIIAAAGYFIFSELNGSQMVPQPSPGPKAMCEPMQYSLTRIFAAKAYKDLANCLAPSVRYSRFESSDSRQLTPSQAVAEITNLSSEVKVWNTNPDDPAVKKLRENYINAWSDAFFALADNKIGFAFDLNREGQIQTVVFMSNYPALGR